MESHGGTKTFISSAAKPRWVRAAHRRDEDARQGGETWGRWFCVLLALAPMLPACENRPPPAPSDLEQAARILRSISSADRLKLSTFPTVYPEGKPSQFVQWFFSILGTREWPLTEAEFKAQFGETRIPGYPLLPEGVAFSRQRPDPGKGRQLVVKSDDAHGTLIVEGYTEPTQKPVLVRVWKLPKVRSEFRMKKNP